MAEKPKQVGRVLGAIGLWTIWTVTCVFPFGLLILIAAARGLTDAVPGIDRRAVVVVILLAWLIGVPVLGLYVRQRLNRRHERRRTGACIRCGHDLRGSGGDSCPECGRDLSDWEQKRWEIQGRFVDSRHATRGGSSR